MGAGGITMPEGPDYEAMAAADRKFMAESEERQMAMMNDMEDKRVAREQAEINRQERVRANEESALDALERDISDNSEAVQKFEEEKDTDVVMDFYSSLQAGSAGKRPE